MPRARWGPHIHPREPQPEGGTQAGSRGQRLRHWLLWPPQGLQGAFMFAEGLGPGRDLPLPPPGHRSDVPWHCCTLALHPLICLDFETGSLSICPSWHGIRNLPASGTHPGAWLTAPFSGSLPLTGKAGTTSGNSGRGGAGTCRHTPQCRWHPGSAPPSAACPPEESAGLAQPGVEGWLSGLLPALPGGGGGVCGGGSCTPLTRSTQEGVQ